MSKQGLVRALNRPAYRIPLLVLLGAVALFVLWPRGKTFRPVDRVPAVHEAGQVARVDGQMVLRLNGAPRELGREHGRLLSRSIRRMLEGYVREGACMGDAETLRRMLGRVRPMKAALPEWYVAELEACAESAGVDADELLLAQCEGDVASLRGSDIRPTPACSAYAVFGKPHISGGKMRVGRNFDYYAGEFIHNCALTTYVTPEESDHYAFAAVGWSGILGGWTLVNSEGLVVANHLGGGPKRDPHGVPTLILTRIVAQTCGTIDEAIAAIEALPRMRGQIVWLAQPGDERAGRPARAVGVEYDAEEVYVREAEDGVLTVSNLNEVFGGKPRSARGPGSVSAELLAAIDAYPDTGRRPIRATGRPNTLHSAEIDFNDRRLYVAHGRLPAQSGPYVAHELP